MSNRYPLILDSSNNKIKELPSGDNLDLTGAGISSVSSISVGAAVTINGTGADITGVVTATNFVGDGSGITGIANTAFIVSTAATFSSEVSVGTAVTIGSYGVHATGIVTATGFVGIVTGNVTGNADSATTLETARNIGGVSFDGTGDINLPGVNATGTQDTSGNAATATTLETARNIGGVSFDGTGDINLPGVNESGNQNTSGTAAGLSGSPTITVTKVNVGTAATISANGNATFAGIVTATSFTGDGTGLTGVASTDNIQTGTPATFLSNVNITGVTTATGGVNVGSSATVFANGNVTCGIITATTLFGDGSNLTGTGPQEADTSVSSTSATTVLSIAHASYRGSFVKVLITQGSAYQIGKYSIIHDGTTATIVEESAVATGSMIGSFSATISGDNLLMQVTMESSSSATVTIKADNITV